MLRWLVSSGVEAPCPPPLADPLPDQLWSEFVDRVVAERIAGLLDKAIDEGLPATPQQHRAATDAYRQAVMHDLRVEEAMLRVAGALDGSNVRWRVIKGAAAARQLHPDPSLRSTGDVDVMVHPDDFDTALLLIQPMGSTGADYPAHGPASRQHAAEQTFVTRLGVELDVHRAVRGPLNRYRIPPALLFEAPQAIEVQGQDLEAPPPAVVVLHAMLHLGTGRRGPTGSARLSTLFDLLVARRHFPSEYSRAHELAAITGNSTPALWAHAVLADWPTGADGSTVDKASPGVSVWAYDRMLAQPGLASVLQRFEGPDRLQRAWEALVPDSAYRRRHDRTVADQLRYVRARLSRRSDQ